MRSFSCPVTDSADARKRIGEPPDQAGAAIQRGPSVIAFVAQFENDHL
jgi:hypothetical protein